MFSIMYGKEGFSFTGLHVLSLLADGNKLFIAHDIIIPKITERRVAFLSINT